MVTADDVDLAADVGMPDRFTPYTWYVTLMLSLTWVFAAVPAMIPAYIAPPATHGEPGNATPFEGFYTVIEEFGLSRDQADLTTSAYFFGSLVLGQIPCAYSDRIGRHPIAFFSALLTGISGLLCCIAPNYYTFLIGRFLQGACFTATTNVNWVMVCESVPFSCHARASIIFGVMWVVGYCIIAPLAVVFPTWRALFLVTSLPMVAYAFLMKWTIRESLAFLVITKRKAEVAAWIRRMESFGPSKFEGGCLDALLDDDNNSRRSAEEPEERPMVTMAPHESIFKVMLQAIRERPHSIYLAISIYMWITDFLVYNGLSMTSTGIQIGNPHWNYVFSGLVELPAAIILPFMMDRLGRRPTVIFTHVETAVTLIALCFIPISWGLIYRVVWLLAKFGTAASFIALYIYGSEIFPVKNRNICLGICCTLGNVGAMLAPQSAQLAVSHPAVVFALYAGVSLFSAFIDLWLPETMHKTRQPELTGREHDDGRSSP